MASENKTIRITKIECNEGTNKNGKPFKRWKVYDETGLYYSGFEDPLVKEGEIYEVSYTRGGEDKQFLNYRKFVKAVPVVQTNKTETTWEKRDRERTNRIEKMHLNKIAAELTNIAITNNKEIHEVVILYSKAYLLLGKEINEHKTIPTKIVKFENED